ncbi:hypothetical protein JOC77_003574 [Peribacillus deserti]|uniref:Uncharacterized protein n=1 Tax=Peribacillus deserti TaxID=673318 RepID=A0ABS2QLS9_9BACI|nr:hypothetical protein [Peribacillus deserti]MBM7694130.1 hypothetical protein [Peribacillus deserti]
MNSHGSNEPDSDSLLEEACFIFLASGSDYYKYVSSLKGTAASSR